MSLLALPLHYFSVFIIVMSYDDPASNSGAAYRFFESFPAVWNIGLLLIPAGLITSFVLLLFGKLLAGRIAAAMPLVWPVLLIGIRIVFAR